MAPDAGLNRMTRAWQVEVGDGQKTSVVFEPALAAGAGSLFVFAHGAGGHMGDRGMLAAGEELRQRGLHVVRFNFLYRENRSGAPDPMPRLKRCYAAVADNVRRTVQADRVILGGRSMGGRVASLLAADSYPCDGLLLLAYPLHPAGKPEQLRDAHLERIRVPVLCFNGTRDALCRRDLMEQAVGGLSDRWTLHWLDGADHSLRVLKSSGRSDQDVLDEVGQASAAWLARVSAAGVAQALKR
jgi:predicted alpha/beta-hydrolase family hydrolase